MGVFTGKDMIYDNFNFAPYVYVEDIRRSFMNLDNTFSNNGKIHMRQEVSPSTIEVDIRIIEKSRRKVGEIADFLKTKFIKFEPKKLQLRDSRLFDMAILDGNIDFERLRNTGFVSLKFINPSGLRYGNLKQAIVTNSRRKMINVGAYRTYPVIKASPKTTVSEIKIRHVESNNFLRLNRQVLAGQAVQFGEIERDYKFLQKVTYNNYLGMIYLDPMSNFFELLPGVNNFELTGVDEIQFEYMEVYL